jgi:molecular chaperone GrpE
MSEEKNFDGDGESSEIHDASQFLSEDTADADDASPLTVDDIINAAPKDKEAELLADLQRLQAEFVNYKNRVERDRDVARNNAIAEVIRAFLPALDDLSRAEKHGDLVDSPFLAVVTKLRNAGDKFGLKSFGAKGEKFDPELHNALVQTPSTDVTEMVIADVVEPGFMLGERLLRPAMVAVFIPTES